MNTTRRYGPGWVVTTVVLVLGAGCAGADDLLRFQPDTCRQAMPADAGLDALCFAVVGDYGQGGRSEAAVATMVSLWQPDFVLTTGDNTFPTGDLALVDERVGYFYHRFIGGYRGRYGGGSDTNRFWPVPGNHDWSHEKLDAWAEFFQLPGNERYYDVDLGLVHFFALDSDPREPDGVDAQSVQAQWLQQRLADTRACYKIVAAHHPPYVSLGGHHAAAESLRWPFAAWGASLVLNGHEHVYERLEVDGLPFVVNGIGGQNLSRGGSQPVPESRVRHTGSWGAMRVLATREELTAETWTLGGEMVDRFSIPSRCP